MLQGSFEMALSENEVNSSDDCQPLLTNNGDSAKDSEKTFKSRSLPMDRCLSVYLIFCYFGMTCLLPYNMFITDTEYFNYKLSNSTQLQDSFESFFTIGTCVPTSIMLFAVVALKHRVSAKVRIVGSLSMMLLIFIGVTSLVNINSESWTLIFFLVTMVFVVGVSVFGAITQGSMAGLAGILPEDYMQGFMSGQAVAGIFASLANIITMAAGSTVLISALSYFSIAAGVVFLAIIFYFLLLILPFSKFYLENNREMFVVRKETDKSTTKGPPPYIYLLKKIWVHALSAALVFAITLSIFPSTVSFTKSTSTSSVNETSSFATSTSSSKQWSDYFIPVSCFLSFNVGDLIGRLTVHWIKWPRNSSLLLACVLGRAVFYPFFLLCNIQPRPSYMPVVFVNDTWFTIFILLFGITNGYFGTLSITIAPGLVEEEHRESVGSLMAFFISLGLDIGSILSLAVNVFHNR